MVVCILNTQFLFRTEVPNKRVLPTRQLVLTYWADTVHECGTVLDDDVTEVSPTFVRLFKLFEFLIRNLIIFLETNVFKLQSPVGLL